MPSPRITCDTMKSSEVLPTQTKPKVKRSFDVAFLMMPDEKMKNRQAEKLRRFNGNEPNSYLSQISVRSDESLREISAKSLESHRQIPIDTGYTIAHNNNNVSSLKNDRFLLSNGIPSPRMYDDPTQDLLHRTSEMPKSAFTKVLHSRQDSPIPPPSSLSPGQLSCSSSSPPISSSPPRGVLYSAANFRPEYGQFMGSSPFHTISQMQQIAAQNQKFKPQFSYRTTQNQSNPSEMPHTTNYLPSGTFPFAAAAANCHPFAPQQDLTGIVRNPAAAALLTTLIPPTIATTFSLTAQNVCAKCNISFRMTSDLVYHMRSHHKGEVATDSNRRKREEKLKCPVCNESFRERHHLTRHMTAHQDKASDDTNVEPNQRRQK